MKLITAFMLFLLLLNSFLYTVYCGMGIWQRKTEVRQSIRGNQYDHSLTRIACKRTKASEALASEDELTYNNSLYDIVQTFTGKDSIILYGLKDDEEQSLVNNLDGCFSQDDTTVYSSNRIAEQVKHSIKPFSQPYYVTYCCSSVIITGSSISSAGFLHTEQNALLDTGSPPPRRAA